MATFDSSSVRRFRFVGYGFDDASLTARLDYAFDDDGPRFREEVAFPGGRAPSDAAGRAALDRCLRMLHLVAGVSYYKAAVPGEIAVETGPLGPQAARFLDRLYLHGLGEFAYKNDLDLRGRIRFPVTGDDPPSPPRLALPRRTAVPVGGGKDSIVTIEALKRSGEPIVLISVGDPEPIREVARVAGGERIVVSRRLAPELLELNRRGALNGHVPISAVLAAIFAVAAVLHGFDAVALSNERSADHANLVWKGFEINHQYSKSSAFERDWGALLENAVLPGFRHFSFLRPFSELAITAAFSRAPAAYRDVFRSCNAAFRLDASRRVRRWCGDCPKCRFVFLALAPFLPREETVRIFGADLLDDPRQEAGFADMLGLGEHKPFECVGEVDECVAALVLLSRSPAWRDAVLVRRFAEKLLPHLADPDRLVENALAPADAGSLPERYRALLPEILSPAEV